jgi:hypothetical protein
MTAPTAPAPFPHERIIRALAADLAPVRRLQPPGLRALLWLAGVAAIAGVLAMISNLPAMAERITAAPDMWLAVIGSTLTMVLATLAAFELSLPDRDPRWALLPLPATLLWLGASGAGCLRVWLVPGTLVPGTHAAAPGEAKDCLVFILLLSVPLSMALIGMLRRAYPMRPGLAAALAGLAAAAAAATLLNFFHPYDASATDIGVHALAVALVIGANRAVGGRILRAGEA